MVSNPITAEQLLRARQLFEEVTSVEESDRSAILNARCSGDEALRLTVEKMITASECGHWLLDKSLALPGALEIADLPPQTAIGRYRVLSEVGAGGMGTVYAADIPDQEPEELFAIKVVRWASPDLLRRFQKEQTILHRLQHPNIARFVEAGVSDQGSPYFVMEYVDGEPIYSYIQQRQLSTDACIGLFRQVCAAVRYLHQNLIIHRDLKPANILVTKEGAVKLVDFGIAKLLQSSSESATNTSVGLMTPDYASPEQVRGEAISTLTDVYALGVLLYELLTGTKPFSSSEGGLEDTLRRICEEDPAKPSEAVRLGVSNAGGEEQKHKELRGELDNIVMKALEKQPDRRYASVEQFDEDLRRYQMGLPVLAQGESVAYRLGKFVIRYKGPVAAGCAMLVLLLGGVIATTIEARTARQQAAEAAKHASEAERQKTFAEHQTQIAEQERNRAEHERAESQRQRQSAERRLVELQKLAKGAADIYTSARTTRASPEAEMIARFAQHSLMALQSERVLRPEQLQLLDATTADVQSYHLATDQSWQTPKGWSAQETKQHEYRVGLDSKVRHTGKRSVFLRSLVPAPSGSVFLYQIFEASRYRSKRVSLTAFLRSEKVASQALLGISFLAPDGSTLAYEGVTRSGTSAWDKQSIVVDVPPGCKEVHFFLQLNGAGTIWADDFAFEVVPTSVPLTQRTQPANLSFTTP